MASNPAEISAHTLILHSNSVEGATVVQCRGRLTTETTSILKAEVKSMMPHTKRIILDLNELVRMDSSGLGTLVSLYVSAKSAGCELSLINMSKPIRDLLGLSHLLTVFESCGRYGTKVG
ncbi:MAG: STAS domain-containing protein [Candidatus Acidiferrales bacterium]